MKVVINRCYGGFGIPEKLHKHFDENELYEYEYPNTMEGRRMRTDEALIEFIETYGDDGAYEFGYSELWVVEIPDNATDWIVTTYDGYETLHWVVDGKIYSY